MLTKARAEADADVNGYVKHARRGFRDVAAAQAYCDIYRWSTAPRRLRELEQEGMVKVIGERDRRVIRRVEGA